MPSNSDLSQRDRARRRSRDRGRLTAPSSPRDRRDAWWVTGFAAMGGAFSGVEPSGWPPGDVVMGALLAGTIALAASRARRWTWMWASVVTFAAASELVWVGLAGLALVLSVAAAVLERRARTWGAVVGALCSQALLHLPDHWDVQGSSAVIVALAILPLLLSGYRRSRDDDRRTARRVLLVGLVAAVAACAAYGAAVVMARQHLQSAVNDAERALELIRDGQTDRAAAVLERASGSFDKAESLLAGPLSLPAEGVPVIGHHARATSAMTRAGADLTAVAQTTVTSARYDDLSPSAGHIDLSRLFRLREPLAESEAALVQAEDRLAELRDDWLVEPVADPLDRLRTEVSDALEEASLARDALEVAPTFLGASGPRNYVVLLAQPAESRFGGGFIGTWAELHAETGQVDLVESGAIEELRSAPGYLERTISGPDEYLERYGRYFPEVNLQNVTASPDFPTVRQVITELYPQTGRPPIDGAIYLDPVGVAALLQLTGPVPVEGISEPLSPENAAEYLSTTIYDEYPDDERRDPVLRNAVDAVFDALTSRDLPGPRTVGEALGDVVRGNHLAFSVTDPEGESFLEQIGATGRFPRVGEGSDFLAVKTANAAPNKIDVYLERSVRYEVHLDPETGEVEATARLVVTNTAPESGLPINVGGNRRLREGDPDAPPPGTAILTTSVWSPLLATSATVDDITVPLELQSEFGYHVYSATLEVRPGQTVAFEVSLSGAVSRPYELVVDHQPLARDDALTVSLELPEGWRAVDLEGLEPAPGDGRELRHRSFQSEDTVIRAGLVAE